MRTVKEILDKVTDTENNLWEGELEDELIEWEKEILKEAADRACALWLHEDSAFIKEINQFKQNTEKRLRAAIMKEDQP